MKLARHVFLKRNDLQSTVQCAETVTQRYSTYCTVLYTTHNTTQHNTTQVIACRRVLKYTYVLGFFLRDSSPEKQLFEHHQEMLEKNTEKLQELTERSLDTIDRTQVSASAIVNISASVTVNVSGAIYCIFLLRYC